MIFRDAAGNYYAIPIRALAHYQVPPDRRAVVASFLNGDEAITLPRFVRQQADSTLHTTRRSNDLWLVFT
ncbi:MAG TPA: hypothetical protein VGK33_04300 [Chloroflexota bacterium]